MPRLPVDDHGIAAPIRERRGDAPFRIERLAALVERRHLEIGPELHCAGVGFQRARQKIDEGRLAGSVRPHDADPVAATDLDAEVADEAEIAVALGDLVHFDHLPARFFRVVQGEPHIGLDAVLLRAHTLAAQREQPFEPALVALSPRAHAIAQPMLLTDDLPVELVARSLLLFENAVPPGLERSKALVEPPRGAAVEPDRRLREIFQEAPVVADQHERRA